MRPAVPRYLKKSGGIIGGTDNTKLGMQMALTDSRVRCLKPRDRSYRTSDDRGLYVEVFPIGSKLWRYKYRYGGKEKRLALGAYPKVKLGAARKKRDAARQQLDEGL